MAAINSCAFKSIRRSKNITYLQQGDFVNIPTQKLNVFAPRHPKQLKDVFIFIHGGNWNSGNKALYSFFGTRLARKNVVAVIIDYPLSPEYKYYDMALASAQAVNWVKKNIEKYGGDPNRIFVSGHSAGGHLAALISVRNNYFDTLGIANPIAGTILIDAAALDMYGYLKSEDFDDDNTYLKTFTTDSAQWKAASPLYFLHSNMPPMLIYQGGKTYPSIKESNEKFIAALKPFAPATPFHLLKGKKHIPMILQFFNTCNPRYKEIISFMKETK